MPARELLDPRSLLLVALACSGCLDHDYEDESDWEAVPRTCKFEPVSEDTPPSAEPSDLLSPTTDLRIDCGRRSNVGRTSVGIGVDGVYVMHHGGTPCGSQSPLFRLEHLDNREDATVTELGLVTELPCWASLQVDDAGSVSLFWQSYFDELWRATPSNEDWWAELMGLDVGQLERAEIVGSQPHLWLRRDEEIVHATTSPDGTWFEQPSLSIEGMSTVTIGLDGSGNQLAYGIDYDTWDLHTFDGTSTEHEGLTSISVIVPVPTAHPTDETHEHAAVLVDQTHVEFLWPRRQAGRTVIPVSPTYTNDPDEPCLRPSDVVAARTADGRVWLAWIVSKLRSSCESASAELGTLRLVEVDPASGTQPREVMRVQLDTDNLESAINQVEHYLGALSLAAFDQQLVLVVADGPEHARPRVLSVDTSR